MTHSSDFVACSNGTKSLLYTDLIHEKSIYVLDVMEKLTHIVLTDGEVSLQRYLDRIVIGGTNVTIWIK